MDVENQPVPVGTRAAKLLVTNVINQVMPLIRYELTDEVTMLAQPNPDPWTGRRTADVEGRLDDAFVYDGVGQVHPHLFRSALGRRRQVLEYQVRQTPTGADIDVRTSSALDTAALSDEIVKGLAALGMDRPRVSIVEVDELDRAGSAGKLRRFIPLATEAG